MPLAADADRAAATIAWPHRSRGKVPRVYRLITLAFYLANKELLTAFTLL